MSVHVDPAKVHTFATPEAFDAWLKRHHEQDEVWIKIHKVKSGLPTISPAEAIEVALCWGWIDAIRKSFDETSFLQRYTPRGRRSIWSKINVATVGRLIADGRMTEHGLRHVEAAKADGRWDAAYAGSRDMTMPEDLQAAIDADPAARAMLPTLTAQNRFALAFRVRQVKTPAIRLEKIEKFVAMLARGETPHPQKSTPKQKPTARPKQATKPTPKPKPKRKRKPAPTPKPR